MNVKKRVLFFYMMNIIGGVCSAEKPVSSDDPALEQTSPLVSENEVTKEHTSTPALEPTPEKIKEDEPVKDVPLQSPVPAEKEAEALLPVVSKDSMPQPVDSKNTSLKKEEVKDIQEKGLTQEEGLTEEEKEENKDVLDTVDTQSTSGNWVFKNYWWKKIQDVYSEIQEAFNKVMTLRMKFFEKQSDVDKEFDMFYQKIGLEQGPFQDILDYALQIIEKEKEDQGYLDKKERAFLERVKSSQRALEQLREDIKSVQELDRKIYDALEVVFQQVDVCNKYMQEVWTISRDVARELSDKEARKQYYDTKGLLEDVNKVHQYLVGPFATYFDQMLKSAHDHTRGIAAQLETLKNSGLDLKKEAHIFEAEDEELERKQAELKEERQKEIERRKQKKEETAHEVGFIEKIIQSVKGFFSSLREHLTSVATSLQNFFNPIVIKVKELFATAGKKVDGAEHKVQDRAEKVKEEVKTISEDVEKSAHVLEEKIKKSVADGAQFIEDETEDAVKYVEEKVKDGAAYVQEKVHEGAEYLEKKAEAISDTLHIDEDDLLDDIETDKDAVEHEVQHIDQDLLADL
ncbi:hypothetical protein K9K77_00535 [Candidatus Babeliales bacterium]|nr:hypothetical protein [Candidatus Babeliales bacterium]